MVEIGVKGYGLALDLDGSKKETNKGWRAWLLALLMVADLCKLGLLTGCGFGDVITEGDDKPTLSPNDPYYDEMMQSYWRERILSFLEELNEVPIKYKHAKEYPTMNYVKKQMELVKTTTECAYEYDSDFTAIRNCLLRNSVDYTNSNPDFKLPFMTEEDKVDLSNEDKMAFEIALEKILQGLIQESTNNVDEDICTLNDYTIVYSYGEPNSRGVLATTNIKDNIMIIYPNIIREYAENMGISFAQALAETLEHETNHIRAEKCECRGELGQQYDYVGNSTLLEASAESNLKYTGSTTLYADEQEYFNERKSEALLLMLGLFKDGFTANDYYNAVFDCNYQAYYEFFGIDANSKEETKTFSNILYSIDAINLRNNLLANHFEEGAEVTDEEIIKFVGQSYKADIFKIVLGNMMNYTIANSDFSLTDNIVLLNVAKSIIVQEATGDPEKAYQIIFNPEFAETTIKLDEIYVNFLSEYYGVSVEEIRSMELSTDIQRKILTLTLTCSDRAYIENEQSEYIASLLERMPLLKQIILMLPVLSTEWPEFLIVHDGISLDNKANCSSSYRVSQVGAGVLQAPTPKYSFAYKNVTAGDETKKERTIYYAKNTPEYQDKLNKDGLCFIKETGYEVSCYVSEDGKKIYWVSETLESSEQYHQEEVRRKGLHLFLAPHARRGGARI